MKREKTIKIGDFETIIRFAEREECFAGENRRKSLLVFDEHTAKVFRGSIRGNKARETITLPAGEEHKNFGSVEAILKKALHAGMSRDDVFYGAGGGVICDITAFAASLYMRGTGCILIPTSLLAMVDASIGGKTGIDYEGYKNMVGTFYPAKEIRICIGVLDSLPEHEYRSGLAEVIKHALLGDQRLLRLLEKERAKVLRREPEAVQAMVSSSIELKGNVVEADFREEGDRAFLNFGHTFGHALESSRGFSTYSHGEGVAWGIHAALLAGCYMGITDAAYKERVKSLLLEYGFTLKVEGNPRTLLNAMCFDKKRRKGKTRFVLQKGFGETLISGIDPMILNRVLEECTE